jgi:HEAT repeat protein
VLVAAFAMTLVLLVGAAAAPHAEAQAGSTAADLPKNITNLGDPDFPARMRAAQLIRRTPGAAAVPALSEAARKHTNEFVRYKALVILTSFNDPGTRELMREMIRDPSDRVREVVYRWFEVRPDPRMATQLLSSLETEQAEFVRPALIGALGALGATSAVQRPMIVETARGLDFFRSAVIESLGRHRAAYALDAILNVARLMGPLQDDAVLAIGRVGGADAAETLKELTELTPEAALMKRAARCLIGDACAEQIAGLVSAASAPTARASEVRTAIDALAAVAQSQNPPALAALMNLASKQSSLRDRVAIAVAGVALRQPDWMVSRLDAADQATRETAILMLKDGFDSLEEDFAEEQFFAAVRAGYWRAPDKSSARTLAETLIQRLEF